MATHEKQKMTFQALVSETCTQHQEKFVFFEYRQKNLDTY